MSREHVEIAHQVRRLGQLLDEVGAEGCDEEDVIELRRLLYGLHAVLRLHTAQEDESYLSLGDEGAPGHEGDGGQSPGRQPADGSAGVHAGPTAGSASSADSSVASP